MNALPRIDDVRDKEGMPDPDARLSAALDAELAAEMRTPDQWARGYAARAYHLLTLKGVDRELTSDETQAGLHLAQAVIALDGHDEDEKRDVRAHLEEASALLTN